MFIFEGDVKILPAIIQKENEDVENMNIKTLYCDICKRILTSIIYLSLLRPL
jgi:hypothetical protein